jgi:hypothetical protein
MNALFRTGYFVAKNRLSLSLFPGLCMLQKLNGVDLGENYANAHAAKDFIHTISTRVARDVLTDLKEAEFIGVCADSSTDRSKEEQEGVEARIVKAGRAVDIFIGMPVLHNAVRLRNEFSVYTCIAGCIWYCRRDRVCVRKPWVDQR